MPAAGYAYAFFIHSISDGQRLIAANNELEARIQELEEFTEGNTNLKSKCDRSVGRGVQLYALTADSCVANIFENGVTPKKAYKK
ncbi:hypothetical protein NIES25_48810 [Nostoc linckia NIES-25]|nr:hypothetical protein NIES25_48810 [Nostoc linckia NIES-25]